MDGDGVETVSAANGVYFDHDGNGFAERTGWVGQDDGLLVRDLNNNGQIDNGSELFGNNTVLSNGKKAANGFEALKDLDSNSDGIFNSSDTAWNEVKVWKDSNPNGLVDNGELITLEQANIKNINLNDQNSTIVDENDNAHKQTGSFTNTSETIGSINDVWFNADFSDTANRVSVEIPEEIKALPNVRAFGNVHDLHSAMALDETGELKALVEDFIAETNVAARKSILLNLIYHWTGVQNMSPNGRDPTRNYGKVIDDTRKLEALEEFMGEEFLGTWCWGDRDPNPHGKAAPYIIRAFDILQEYINHELLAQTHYKPLLENVKLEWNTENSAWNIDVSGAVAKLQKIYNANALNGALTLTEFGQLIKKQNTETTQDIIATFKAAGNAEGEGMSVLLTTFADVVGTANDDNLTGSDNMDVISGEDGNDTIYAGKGDDTLIGGNGNDSLWGEDGNDTLIGGNGNDYLNGGNGADTYVFEPGFGHDTIDNTDDNASADEPDIVQFGEGISPDMVTISREGFDLILTVKYAGSEQTDDSIRILSYFDKAGTTSATVNAITFTDGTSWDVEYVYAHHNLVPNALGGRTIIGGDGYDWIVDSAGDDLIIANGGDDVIRSGAGNDIIIGGPGNDEITSTNGNKTYIYNLGDGCDFIYASHDKDKILFGEGISFEDLTFSAYNGNGLQITVKNDPNQTIRISGFMWGRDRVNDLAFADGSIYHLSDMPLTLIQTDADETIYATGNGDTIFGMGGNDKIYGSNADEIIIGGTGDDQLEGGYGNDTYIWNLGDGLDTIQDSNGTNDRIKFGPGITKDDLRFVKGGSYSGTLYIYVKNDFTQGVILYNNFNTNNIEYVELNDGTTISLKEEGLFFNQTDADDAMTGTEYNDIIYGNGGNDSLSGGGGNDIIVGGPGDDKLYGNYGNDTYIYNLGDGFDTIKEQDGNDTVRMGEGITRSNLTFERRGDTLNIYVDAEKTQGVSIYQQYNWNGYMVENLELADGTIIDLSSADKLFPPQNKIA